MGGGRNKEGKERGRGWTEVGTSKEESLKREVVVSAKNTAIFGGVDLNKSCWGT